MTAQYGLAMACLLVVAILYLRHHTKERYRVCVKVRPYGLVMADFMMRTYPDGNTVYLLRGEPADPNWKGFIEEDMAALKKEGFTLRRAFYGSNGKIMEGEDIKLRAAAYGTEYAAWKADAHAPHNPASWRPPKPPYEYEGAWYELTLAQNDRLPRVLQEVSYIS